MFAPVMSGKLQTNVHELSDAAKARIVRELKKGDKARIAEVCRTSPDYVKDVFSRRPQAKSVLARRIWLAAHRLLADRQRLQDELHA
jgi:hypothetical protein